jgi:hypothetical protein
MAALRLSIHLHSPLNGGNARGKDDHDFARHSRPHRPHYAEVQDRCAGLSPTAFAAPS